MKYLFVLMLLVTVSIAQQKEQRYIIYTISAEYKSMEFPHVQIPTIGSPKQIPIKLDTWTGDTWMLDAILETSNGKNVIRWKWVKLETELPTK